MHAEANTAKKKNASKYNSTIVRQRIITCFAYAKKKTNIFLTCQVISVK